MDFEIIEKTLVKVFIDTPKFISMTEGYLNDYNRNRTTSASLFSQVLNIVKKT